MKHFTLDPTVMRTWGKGMWFIFFVLFGMIAAILAFTIKGYIAAGVLKYYVAWASALFGFLVWNTKRLAPERHIHVHHYLLAMIILSLVCFQSVFLTCLLYTSDAADE